MFFRKNAALGETAHFCSRREESHVFQVKQVRPALDFWIQRVDNSTHWTDIIDKVDDFEHDGSTKYTAKWNSVFTDTVNVLTKIVSDDTTHCHIENYLDRVFDCCHACNVVMDVTARQMSRLVEYIGQSKINVSFDNISSTPYPLQITEKQKNNSIRSAFIAYYLHSCLPRTLLGDDLTQKEKESFKLFLVLTWLIFIIVCKYEENGQSAGQKRPQYNYKGNTELYISWFLYLRAKHDFAKDVEFESYHLFLMTELPYLPDWDRSYSSIVDFVFHKNNEEINDVTERMCELYDTYGRKMYVHLAQLFTPSLLSSKDLKYLVTPSEAAELVKLQSKVSTIFPNPGAFIRLIGALPMLNPFYRNMDEEALRTEVQAFIKYHAKNDYALVRTRNSEFAGLSEEKAKLLYQMQFLLDYDEKEVKTKVTTLSVRELQRIVDTAPRCSTWKAVIRIQKLFPPPSNAYADLDGS